MRAPTAVGWSTPREALDLFLRGRTARTAVPAAAVVGTVLSAVNQGAIIASGAAGAATWIRVGVNYVVPFCVASFGFLSARRRPSPTASEPGAVPLGRSDAASRSPGAAVTGGRAVPAAGRPAREHHGTMNGTTAATEEFDADL